MSAISILILVLYAIGLIVIFLYTLAQVHLVYHYLKGRASRPEQSGYWDGVAPADYPAVTVQLPVYNERYVIKRLIGAVARFDWPEEKLEIQVLDDSTDETTQIIADRVHALRKEGLNIRHVRRGARIGFKAGALQHGLERAEGQFIAIFDADFVPGADFLKRTIPAFDSPQTGMVQARWGHLNQDYSLLTRVQAFALNGHFTIEQKGRNRAGYFMNFNGTAGVWRRRCIEDAGGWHHDTLTEDLDLSYRAQLKGWQFEYMEEVVSPAELPVAISALKTQQYRWTKGAAESARKHLGSVWQSEGSLMKKIQASTHLLSSSVFLFILLIAVLSVPLLWIKSGDPVLAAFFKFAGFFIVGLFGWVLFYGASMAGEEGTTWQKTRRMTVQFPLFLSLSMGLSAHNSIAVIRGLAGKASPFIRTPKFNVTGLRDTWTGNKYLKQKINPSAYLEGGLSFYFGAAVIASYALGDFGMLAFHLLLLLGFGTIFGYSLYERMLSTA